MGSHVLLLTNDKLSFLLYQSFLAITNETPPSYIYNVRANQPKVGGNGEQKIIMQTEKHQINRENVSKINQNGIHQRESNA
jgi:hypothetical protein